MNMTYRPLFSRLLAGALLLGMAGLACANTVSGMTPMADQEMQAVAGQGLFWSDKISGSELAGSNAYSTPFTFYRMGIDGAMALNSNLSKLQLGCGGVNDFINAQAGCDIDIDYVSMMGRNGTNPGNPLSAFTLTRPYIELAVKNDGTAQREIVGLKIGAAAADGAMTTGRTYRTNGAVNQENTLGWSNAGYGDADVLPTRADASGVACNPGNTQGATVLACHSGINSVSGFLGTEMSLTMKVKARVLIISLDEWGCTGRTTSTVDNCGNGRSDALFLDVGGTRMQTLGLRSAQLKVTGSIGGLLSLVGIDGVYASLNADLRLIHKLTFEGGGFGVSFQREPVAYPNFSKMTPIAEMTANGTINTAFDACAVSGWQTTRCYSAYAVPANTGWWLNTPNVKLLDVFNPNADLGSLSIGAAFNLLSAPGILLDQPEFAMNPAKNCYGASRFC